MYRFECWKDGKIAYDLWTVTSEGFARGIEFIERSSYLGYSVTVWFE